jgi:hypothetical protein
VRRAIRNRLRKRGLSGEEEVRDWGAIPNSEFRNSESIPNEERFRTIWKTVDTLRHSDFVIRN